MQNETKNPKINWSFAWTNYFNLKQLIFCLNLKLCIMLKPMGNCFVLFPHVLCYFCLTINLGNF